MALLSNTCVFALMVLPVVLLAKGHHVNMRRLTALAAIITACRIAESTIMASFTISSSSLTFFQVMQYVFSTLVLPLMDTALVHFVLNDQKARKVLHVQDAGDDAAAVFVTVWTVVDLLLYRWFRWYRVIGSAGFDAANLNSAAESFVGLLTMLLAARCINGRGGNGHHNYNNNNNNSNNNSSKNNNSNDNTPNRVWVVVALLRIVATTAGLVVGTPLFGGFVYTLLLLVLLYFFLSPVNNSRKED
ncbi:hypothetical protein LSM04_004778 [Trypanosoma melophagium]|uniref:uncharacterized protein n=1 Tax=Trypanosoma melophagium TaxID=715481 RepID=UPI00351A737F|nr:hypothetical protein LSM04_004778 [Trypanosoma melophagium]